MIGGKVRRIVAPIVLLCSMSVALAACGSTPSTASTGGTSLKAKIAKIKVGGIIWGRYIDYWRLVQLGMQAAAKHYNVPIQIGTSDKDLGTEAQVVQQMQAAGVNVLVISPFSATGSTQTLSQAAHNGMTVVQYNTQVNDQRLKNFVGVSNFALGQSIGKAARQYIETKLGGTAQVGVLSDIAEPGGADRLAGFLSELKGLKGVSIVANETAAKIPEGAAVLPTMIQGHPDINVVFAWNGGALEGATDAAVKMGAKVKIFGIDLGQTVATELENPKGPVVAVADQHPYQLGYDAVQLGIEARIGQTKSKVIGLTPTIYSQSVPAMVKQWLAQEKQVANQ